MALKLIKCLLLHLYVRCIITFSGATSITQEIPTLSLLATTIAMTVIE